MTARVIPDSLNIPMRDGEELNTRVWKPAGSGPFPVILERGYDPGIDWHAECIRRTAMQGQSAGRNVPHGQHRRL